MVNIEDLVRFSAPTRLLVEFGEMYDNESVSIMDILENKGLTVELILFIHKYCVFTEEEEAKFKEVAVIKDDNGVVSNSALVENSDIVLSSISVKDSTNVRYSNGVNKSSFVFDSTSVNLSSYVFRSAQVDGSYNVFNSFNVSASNDVVGSTDITWSKRIVNTSRAEDCALVGNSEGVYNCFCSINLKDCQNCLFCFGLQEKEYYIFNEQVTPQEFEKYLEVINYSIDYINSDMIEFNKKNIVGGYDADDAIKKLFIDAPSQLFMDARELPNYSKTLLKLLTFSSIDI